MATSSWRPVEAPLWALERAGAQTRGRSKRAPWPRVSGRPCGVRRREASLGPVLHRGCCALTFCLRPHSLTAARRAVLTPRQERRLREGRQLTHRHTAESGFKPDPKARAAPASLAL